MIGRGAGRALRAVVDFRPPYGVSELAGRANVSPATLARVIDLLVRDALVTRDARGRVNDVDWDGCLRRWSKDYEFATSNQTTAFLAPRGLSDVTSKLATVKWRYALSGSLAAQAFSEIAPARFGMLYVEDVETAVRQLDLREVDSGANVLIAEPFDPVVFERTTKRDGHGWLLHPFVLAVRSVSIADGPWERLLSDAIVQIRRPLCLLRTVSEVLYHP